MKKIILLAFGAYVVKEIFFSEPPTNVIVDVPEPPVIPARRFDGGGQIAYEMPGGVPVFQRSPVV